MDPVHLVVDEVVPEQFSYPLSAFGICKVVEENYNCAPECPSSNACEEDAEQLGFRLLQRKIRVLRANIGRLLCICVPDR
jgi:hypothetical protein